MSFFAIRIVGYGWYGGHEGREVITTVDLNDKTKEVKFFRTREAALNEVVVVAALMPQWIGDFRVKRVRKIRRQVIERMCRESAQLRKYERDHYVAR